MSRQNNDAYGHFAVVVNGWRPEDKARDVCRDFLPAVVFHDTIRPDMSLSLRVVGSKFLGEKKLGVGNASGSNLERLPHKLVLRVDLTEREQ